MILFHRKVFAHAVQTPHHYQGQATPTTFPDEGKGYRAASMISKRVQKAQNGPWRADRARTVMKSTQSRSKSREVAIQAVAMQSRIRL